jgi:hypothetical protein
MDLRPAPMQPRRFYDGGTATEPPDRTAEPRVLLERVVRHKEQFRMLRRIAYDDGEYGEILVPDDTDTFLTDFASVPAIFTWLVPKSGRHLPAALVHDGLVHPRGEPTYVSSGGHVIDRVGADRVFRDAMRDSEVGFVRRWLVWSVVTLATIAGGSEAWSPVELWRRRLAMAGTMLVVVVLGVIATLDLLDRLDWLPWMGERVWWVELAGGLAAAIVLPLLLGLAWGRFWVAGAVASVALALLLHVTVLLGLLSLLYLAAEWLARRRSLALPLSGAILVAACAVLMALLWVV